MRIMWYLYLIFSIFLVFPGTESQATGGTVVGLSADVDELELYKSPKDEDPAHVLGAGDLSFPAAILGVSKNGMFKIKQKGAAYWVISDDVKSDVTRKVDTACDPKMAGTVVAHGKRGAGEGCK
ncbi:MAG: hypothetical protein GKS00_20755 [Alphaproteobacteria bacterium]|nr:hypothetical protein [Alphaproteobacteria bacterium]